MTKRRKPPTPVPDFSSVVPDFSSVVPDPAMSVELAETRVALMTAEQQIEDVAEKKDRQQRGNRKRQAERDQKVRELRELTEQFKQDGERSYLKLAARELGYDYEYAKELLKTKKRP